MPENGEIIEYPKHVIVNGITYTVHSAEEEATVRGTAAPDQPPAPAPPESEEPS
jgi:hypothetical protein